MKDHFGKTPDPLSGSTLLKNSTDPLVSPWLKWIRETLGTHSIDVVHFIADSTFYLDDGALLLDRLGPVKTQSHLVTASELLSFQAQIGAWGTGLTSARGNFSD